MADGGNAERRTDRADAGRDLPPIKVERSINVKALVAVVAAALAVVFVLQNGTKVTTTFLFWDVTTRQWVGILVALVLGAVIGQVLESMWRRRKGDRAARKRAKDPGAAGV